MKKLAFLAYFVLSTNAWAAACCAGGSAKSFITLARLQTYEVGLSTTFRDVYGEYNLYGDLEETQKNQTATLLFGAGARLTQELQVSLAMPLVNQRNAFGTSPTSRSGLGDITLGAQYIALESLFLDDWWPTITVLGGAKLPTGTEEEMRNGRRFPGTGNGIWEPYLGVQAHKVFGAFSLLTRATFTLRPAHAGVDRGDGIDLVESFTWLPFPELSATIGATQVWNFNDRIGGATRPDTATRGFTFFASPTYFLTRYWSIAAGVEATPSWERLGVNSQAFQSVSVTTRYGFY